MSADELEAQIELRQRAQAQEVDLEKAESLDVVLIPLNDGAALHRGVLDGHEIVNRLVAEQESARVYRQMSWKVLNLLSQAHEQPVPRVIGVEATSA